MATTSAERMALLRKRKAEDAARFEKQVVAEAYAQPFFEWLDGPGTLMNVQHPLDNAGLDCPSFDDDSGGHSLDGHFEQVCEEQGTQHRIPTNSLQRAEMIVGCWIDAAMELASEINAYKRHHLEQRIAGIEATDAIDEAAAEKVRLLRRLLSSLSKDVRRTFPNWKASAE